MEKVILWMISRRKKYMAPKYDVLIIGAGVVGSAIARELARYKLKTGVLEKDRDVGCEASGSNSAVIHGGVAYESGTLN
jgi:glycerol-3-phosphate dehydrogenase